MRETIVVAFGAGGIGAVLGAAAVLAFHAPEPRPVEPAIDEKVLAAAFERAFAKGVADLRRDLSALRDARAAPTAAGAPAEDSAPRRPPVAVDDTADPARVTRRRAAQPAADAERESPFDAPNPLPRYDRLKKCHGWDERPELRRTWLFADEAACLDWFGTPDDVNGDGTWYYNEPLPDADGDGEPDGRLQYVLQFHSGRIFRIDAPEPDAK